MVMPSILLGTSVVLLFAFLVYWVLSKVTIQVQEQTEGFLLSFGKLHRAYTRPGLHWAPSRVLPWTDVIMVSKQIDYRTYKGIQVNDSHGTTVIVDLWVEFRIADPYRALFGVENWEEVMESVVTHSVASILCSQTVDKILRHRTELAEQLKASIAGELERWGISLLGAMVQNIGLLPEVSKQFFHSVAARIERSAALIQEEGRLRVAKLEATTSYRIAELNGLARAQLPNEIGSFYQRISKDPILLAKFQEYWDLTNLDPKKTISFSGFGDQALNVVEVTKAMESIVSH